jgi:hypothetical protein
VLTITEVFPGSQAAFTSITAGAGSVTVDPSDSSFGLQGFTLVSATNANVFIPSFPFGTTAPVTATFTRPNPSQPVDFTLRASMRSQAVMIRAQCSAPAMADEALGIYRSMSAYWMPRQTTGGMDGLIGAFEKVFLRNRDSRPADQ